jgi:hypothetical protein
MSPAVAVSWRLYWDAEEGKLVCVVDGRGMLWPGVVMRFCDLPWLRSGPVRTGTANAARGARRAIENLKNNIFVKGVM